MPGSSIFTTLLCALRFSSRDGLLKRGMPVYLVDHLVTMVDLHRAGPRNYKVTKAANA